MTKPHIRRIPATYPAGAHHWAVYSSRSVADRGGFPGMVCRDFSTLIKAPVFKPYLSAQKQSASASRAYEWWMMGYRRPAPANTPNQ